MSQCCQSSRAACLWAPSSSVLHRRKGSEAACSAETVRVSLRSAPFGVSVHVAALGVKGKKTYLAKETYLLQKLVLVRHRELGLGAFCLHGFSSCKR